MGSWLGGIAVGFAVCMVLFGGFALITGRLISPLGGRPLPDRGEHGRIYGLGTVLLGAGIGLAVLAQVNSSALLVVVGLALSVASGVVFAFRLFGVRKPTST
jgi:hypothetical protein